MPEIRCRVVYHRLHRTLVEYEIADIVIKRRGSYAVDTDRFICDFYEFIREQPCVSERIFRDLYAGISVGEEYDSLS